MAGCPVFLGMPLLLCYQLGRACGACREFSRVASTFSAAACFAIACCAPRTRMLRCLAFSNDPHRPCIRHTQTCLIAGLGGPHWAAPEGRRARHRNGTQGAFELFFLRALCQQPRPGGIHAASLSLSYVCSPTLVGLSSRTAPKGKQPAGVVCLSAWCLFFYPVFGYSLHQSAASWIHT